MNTEKKIREFITSTPQQIEYYVMWALEQRKETQACWIEIAIKKEGIEFTRTQISGALQRLKKQGLVYYNGCWGIVEKH